MNNEELPKAAHPDVISHIELLFEKPMVLIDTMNGLIESQHYEAATQVGKRLTSEMLGFKKELAFIKTKAEEYRRSLEPQPTPAEPATPAEPHPAI